MTTYDNKPIDTGISAAIGHIKTSVGKRKKTKRNSNHKGYAGQGGPMQNAIKGMPKMPSDQLPLTQRLKAQQGMMMQKKSMPMMPQMPKGQKMPMPKEMPVQPKNMPKSMPSGAMDMPKILDQLRKARSGKIKIKAV